MPRASSKALPLYSVLSYWNRLYNSHFVDENAEAQRVCVACLRSHLHYKRLILSRFLAPNPMLVPEGYSPMALFDTGVISGDSLPYFHQNFNFEKLKIENSIRSGPLAGEVR